MDIICCCCGKKYGEREAEEKRPSHGICPTCVPQYMLDNGFTQAEVDQCMEKWHENNN